MNDPRTTQPAESGVGLVQLVGQVGDIYQMLKEGLAGHSMAVNAVDGLSAKPGERKKALPVVLYRGSISGVDAVDVKFPWNDCPQEVAQQLLTIIGNTHAASMASASSQLYEVAVQLKRLTCGGGG